MISPCLVARFCVLGLALALVLGGCSTSGSFADSVMSQLDQQSATPDSVLADLKAGNARYLAGKGTRFDYLSQAKQTAKGQYPKAIILSCLDSRVLPEAVFDQGIGDLFVGRVAGNFVNRDQLGSMEFGAKLAGSKLVVVMGHTSCGAVKGAIDQAQLGNLTGMLENLESAVLDVPVGHMGRTSKDLEYVNAVVVANVHRTVANILSGSPVLQGMVLNGELKVVGALYDLASGRVTWL